MTGGEQSRAIAAAVRRALSNAQEREPLHEPEIGAADIAEVVATMESGWVSYAAPSVRQFEAALAARCGRRRALSTNTGTAALHLALLLMGVQTADEVLMPSLTFVATANACAYCGAVPHFVDSDAGTLGLAPSQLAARLEAVAERSGDGVVNRETGRRIGAIVTVHVFGHPSADEKLARIAREWGLPFIVDATESLGSQQGGRPAAAAGDVAVLSFNGNKIVTTGGGGALVTDDDALADRAGHLSTTAKRAHAWAFEHEEVAFNYRLPGLLAALGLAQLAKLDDFVERKRALAESYRASVAGLAGLSFVAEPEGTRSNYWLNAIRLDDATLEQRDRLLATLHADGLLARPLWTPMHRLPMFAEAPRGELATAERLFREIVCLPSSPRLAPAR